MTRTVISQGPDSQSQDQGIRPRRTLAAKAIALVISLAPGHYPGPGPELNDHLSSQVLDTLDEGSRVGSGGG